MYLSILSSFLLHFDNVVSIIFNLSAAPTPSGLIHCCIEVAVACIIPVFNLTIVHVCSNCLQTSPQSQSAPWSATVDNPSVFSPLALFLSLWVSVTIIFFSVHVGFCFSVSAFLLSYLCSSLSHLLTSSSFPQCVPFYFRFSLDPRISFQVSLDFCFIEFLVSL